MATSADHTAALIETQRMAAFSGRVPGSADLLLGLMRVGGAAARLLYERGVTHARLESHLGEVRPEPATALRQLDVASHQIALHLDAAQATSLHLLLAILRTGGAGMDLLRLSGHEPARVRSLVMRALTGPGRFSERSVHRASQAGAAPKQESYDSRSQGRESRGGLDSRRDARQDRGQSPGQDRGQSPGHDRGQDRRFTPPPGAAAPRARPTQPQGSQTRAPGLRLSSPHPPARSPAGEPGPAFRETTRGFQRIPTPMRKAAVWEVPGPAGRVEPVATAPDSAFDLIEVASGRNPVVHREREIGRLLDLLCVASGRIACVVGEPGSGRSAVVAALAPQLAEKPAEPSAGPSPATGGTPGSWLQAIHEAAPPDLPILIDGCAALGGENSDGPAQLLATARGGRRWILLATPADVRRFELGAPELASNLEIVALQPLEGEQLEQVVEHGLSAVADAHGIDIAPGMARALIRLSPRYPTDRAQPGRALAIAEIAAARATRLERPQVTLEEIAAVVAGAAGIPVEQLMRTDDDRFRNLEARLSERVVGHDDARARIAAVIRRSYAGFRGRRPLASILVLGPTGVGKTETARSIAEALFDSEQALVRIDLSEFNESHSVARLIGSPPGYVGHEEGGQLTEAVRRRPACVVLLDEFEKAHRDVLLLLLQILEDGRLTDGRGRTVDFSATTIVMTSNLGTELYRRSKVPPEKSVTALARTRLPAELWNRIDEVLCYSPLREDELRQIVHKLAADSSRRLLHEREISFSVDDAVVSRILAEELDRTLGARPLRRAFERLVEGPIAAQILAGEVAAGSRLRITCRESGPLMVTVL